MTSISGKETEWILETIDHLRRRKARPDVERICHVVRRRYGLSAAETEAKLEKLVDAEIVIKVDYKGDTSYRNAAKWKRSMLGCAVLNSTAVSVKLLEAILDLSKSAASENACNDPGKSKKGADWDESQKKSASMTGASLENINVWLQQHCDGFNQLKSPLAIALKREIDAGRIKRLGNGNYVISQEQVQEISDGVIRPLKSNRKFEGGKLVAGNSAAQQQLQQHLSVANKEKKVVATSSGVATARPAASSGGSSSSGGQQKSVGQTPQQNVQQAAPQQQQLQQPAKRGRPPKPRPPPTAPVLTPQGQARTEDMGGAAIGPSPPKLKRMPLLAPKPSPVDKKTAKRSPSSSYVHEQPLCDVCKQTSFRNTLGEPESLLSCKDCNAQAHPSCMKYAPLLASRAYKGPWQCMDCKTCCVCHDPGDSSVMLVCDGCDKGYHLNCHQPAVGKRPSGSWECSSCKMEVVVSQRKEFLAQHGGRHYQTGSGPPTPSESPVSMTNGHPPLPTSPIYSATGMYPDASGWSVDDVVKYVSTAGFAEEAEVFREQEIDGVALLLLKRTDVLRGLDLKLGPALKINRHVQGLQAARDGMMV